MVLSFEFCESFVYIYAWKELFNNTSKLNYMLNQKKFVYSFHRN